MKISISGEKKQEDLANSVTIPIVKQDEENRKGLYLSSNSAELSETSLTKTQKVKEAIRNVCNGLAITASVVLIAFIFCLVFLFLMRLATSIVWADQRAKEVSTWEFVTRTRRHFTGKIHELETKQEFARNETRKLSLLLAEAEFSLNALASDFEKLKGALNGCTIQCNSSIHRTKDIQNSDVEESQASGSNDEDVEALPRPPLDSGFETGDDLSWK